MVIHEPDLQRLAGLPDAVSALSLADLQSVDVGSHFSAEFAGASIPTLREVLETFGGTVTLHLEVKEYGIQGDGTAVATAALVERMGLTDVLVSSYNVFSLFRIRAAHAGIPLGLVYPPLGGSPGPRRALRNALFGKPLLARHLDARVLLPQHRLVTTPHVRAAHRAGREVHAWPVNDPGTMREMAGLGVDAILTDRPDLAIDVMRRR